MFKVIGPQKKKKKTQFLGRIRFYKLKSVLFGMLFKIRFLGADP